MNRDLTVVESAEFALERAFRMADPADPARSPMLREAARLFANEKAARGEPAARQIDAVTRIARRAGVDPRKRDARLAKALAWCAEPRLED